MPVLIRNDGSASIQRESVRSTNGTWMQVAEW